MSGRAPGLLDRVVAYETRHRRAIGALSAIWFSLGCAAYARFIDLPAIPFVTDRTVLYASAAWNAVWWGFVRPALDRRA